MFFTEQVNNDSYINLVFSYKQYINLRWKSVFDFKKFQYTLATNNYIRIYQYEINVLSLLDLIYFLRSM